MSKLRGYTLIEVVFITIILGIVSSVAVPKFVDLRKDVQIGLLSKIEMALKNTSTMVNSTAIVLDLAHSASSDIDIDGKPIKLVYGYPKVVWDETWKDVLIIENIAKTSSTDICDHDLCVNDDVDLLAVIGGDLTAQRSMVIYPEGKSITSNCYVFYNQDIASEAKASPRIGKITSGC